MRFTKGQNYRLTEIGGALVISAADMNVKDRKSTPLVIADAGALITYLDRFFFERENGKTLKDAHELALRTAHIPLVSRATEIAPAIPLEVKKET